MTPTQRPLEVQRPLNPNGHLKSTAAGWLLAAYHCLLYAKLIPASMQPCGKGVSCTEEYLELFGFLSIPALSLISFTALMSILIALKRRRLE